MDEKRIFNSISLNFCFMSLCHKARKMLTILIMFRRENYAGHCCMPNIVRAVEALAVPTLHRCSLRTSLATV